MLKRNYIIAGIYLIIAVFVGYTNLHIGSFFDESDYVLGACLLANQKIMYLDFFSHHLPIPYFVLSFLYFIVGCKIFLARYFVLFIVFGAFIVSSYISKNVYNGPTKLNTGTRYT
ncbi:MAG: hypothetical protein WCO06_05240 [Candidatus Roizmanbacteria bacterium]